MHSSSNTVISFVTPGFSYTNTEKAIEAWNNAHPEGPFMQFLAVTSDENINVVNCKITLSSHPYWKAIHGLHESEDDHIVSMLKTSNCKIEDGHEFKSTPVSHPTNDPYWKVGNQIQRKENYNIWSELTALNCKIEDSHELKPTTASHPTFDPYWDTIYGLQEILKELNCKLKNFQESKPIVVCRKCNTLNEYLDTPSESDGTHICYGCKH